MLIQKNVLLWLALALYVVDAAGQTPPLAPKLPAAEAQQDFDTMRKALEEAHTGLYRYTAKPQMDKVFAKYRAQLDKPVSTNELMGILSQALSEIRCGHTGIQPSNELRAAAKATPLFPIQVAVEKERLIAAINETPDDRSIRPGMEILEINGHKSRDVLARMYSAVGGDGDIETGKRAQAVRNFSIFYWLLVDQSTTFSIKAKSEKSEVVVSQIPGIRQPDWKGRQNPVNAESFANRDKLDWTKGNLSLRFLKDPDIAQIRIRGFGGNDYPAWMENTFKTLAEKRTKTLIIDLRGNGGGDDMYGAMLVSYLTGKPFRYFEHISMKTIEPSEFLSSNSEWKAGTDKLRSGTVKADGGGYRLTPALHQGLAEQQPARHPFTGKVVFLIDGGTFSTSADVCAVIHHLKRATFVGEETGGGYQGNNSGMQTAVTLPNSKFRLRLPMYEYWNAVSRNVNARRGTRPDHEVQNTIANLTRGIDDQLNQALKLADK